ncbi:MAG TPA: polysaccharide deacetylase family protein [Steroidobacteraceae bacterium]|jgi:hypothetical protein
MQRCVAIAIHDVAPATQSLCCELADLIQTLAPGTPLTLLVVPDYHRRGRIEQSSAFRRWIDARLASGDELALHGFWHLDEAPPPHSVRGWLTRRVLTDGEAEFAALESVEARGRLTEGCNAFQRCGWSPAGFVPPAWQISADAARLLTDFPFSYVASHTRIERLPDHRRFESFALSASTRNAWRRWTSQHWMRLWLRRYREAPFVRVALHPADACHDDIMQSWSETLSVLLEERRAVTKGEWVGSA